RENIELDARVRDLQTRSVRPHGAALHVVLSGRAMNFIGLTRQAWLICDAFLGRRCTVVGCFRSWHIQRRVPKSLPTVLIQDLRSDLDTETFQRQELLISHAPQTGNDMEVCRQIRSQSRPCPALVPESDILDERSAILQTEP